MVLDYLRKSTEAAGVLSGMSSLNRSLLEMAFVRFWLDPWGHDGEIAYREVTLQGAELGLMLVRIEGASIYLIFDDFSDPVVARIELLCGELNGKIATEGLTANN
jgi:hypothetical protein